MQKLAGQLLIAPPAVKGNFWYKTVILVTEHHNQGSIGLVLNKRSQMSVVEFGEQLGFTLDVPGFVYLGGPVDVKSLSFLHSNDWASKNTMRVSNEFSISSADDILPRLALGDQPSRWRLFLGMCGWGPTQLHNEIKGIHPWKHEHSWLTAKYDEELVFGSDNNDQWCTYLDRSGQEFAQNVLT